MAAEYPPVPLLFRDDRWRLAGATDQQLAELFTAWNALDTDARWAENARIASLSNDDLAAELATGVAAAPAAPTTANPAAPVNPFSTVSSLTPDQPQGPDAT